MKKNNEDDAVIDEDSFLGPSIQKTGLYKNMSKEICIHVKVKDTYPFFRSTKKLKDRGIKLNFYKNPKREAEDEKSKKKSDYYVAKYLFIWYEMLVDTFVPIADSLDRDPLEFITEQLRKNCDIFKESIDMKEIKKVEEVKKNIIKKADAESQKRIKSIVAE